MKSLVLKYLHASIPKEVGRGFQPARDQFIRKLKKHVIRNCPTKKSNPRPHLVNARLDH